jgi:hypothetical protein
MLHFFLLISEVGRYMLDRHSGLQVVDEVHKDMTNHDKNGFQISIQNFRLPSIIKDFVLPAGHPGEYFFMSSLF